MKRNLAVGHFLNEPFVDVCKPWVGRIREVFFAWPGVLSCRPAPDFTPELRRRMVDDLLWCRSSGIQLDTLFNCNCYGDDAIGDSLHDLVVSTLEDMEANGLFPDIVTTTSPFIATVLRRRFPEVKIRWSVNLRVHGTLGFECVDELFDSFYVSRERQREPEYLASVAEWARKHGKTMGMQANSGCLRQCPFQTFHDNLHGHGRVRQSQIGDRYDFSVFRCRTNYARRNYEDFIRGTWVRPEDVPVFEPYVSVVKLATRRHRYPRKVLDAYASYRYDGNLLDLLDPVHSDLFSPKIIDNRAFPSDFARNVGACPNSSDCRHCGRCVEVLNRVLR